MFNQRLHNLGLLLEALERFTNDDFGDRDNIINKIRDLLRNDYNIAILTFNELLIHPIWITNVMQQVDPKGTFQP